MSLVDRALGYQFGIHPSPQEADAKVSILGHHLRCAAVSEETLLIVFSNPASPGIAGNRWPKCISLSR
jgi:hypothetical protein